MSASPPPRGRAWDPLAPPSLLLFFWLSDLLIPYFYAIAARPWERQSGMMSIIDIQDVHLALLASLVFLAAWFVGYAATTWRPHVQFALQPPAQPQPAAYLVLAFLGVLALFVLLYMLNPNKNFASRMELTTGAWGRVLFLVIGVLFAAFWLSALGLLRSEGRVLPLWRVLTVLALSALMIVVFAPLEGRARMLIAVLYMLVVWHYFVRRLSTAAVWGALGVGLLVALGLDYLRLSSQVAQVDALEMAYGLAYGRQFDGILNIAVLLRALSLGLAEHHYGAAWIADILADLGVRTDQLTSRAAFMTDVLRMPRFLAGFPLTRPGEFLFAFGWAGLVIGAALLGALTRLWYNWLMLVRPFGPASTPIYFTALMTAGLVTQKNYLFSTLVMTGVYVVLILLLALTVYGYRFHAHRGVAAYRHPAHP